MNIKQPPNYQEQYIASKKFLRTLVGILTIIFFTLTIPLASAAQVEDQLTGDLNTLSGAVADNSKIQVTTKSVLTLSTGNLGQAASIDANGITTALNGDFTISPSDMRDVTPSAEANGYNYHTIKTNNPSGFSLYLMMCTATTDSSEGWLAVVNCAEGQNLVKRKEDGTIDNTASTSIVPTAVGSSLSGTVSLTVGGFWGYSNNYTTNRSLTPLTSDALTDTSLYKPVPAFSAGNDTSYGDIIMDSDYAGAGAANTVFSVATNHQLPVGTYANYVIYTAVAK